MRMFEVGGRHGATATVLQVYAAMDCLTGQCFHINSPPKRLDLAEWSRQWQHGTDCLHADMSCHGLMSHIYVCFTFVLHARISLTAAGAHTSTTEAHTSTSEGGIEQSRVLSSRPGAQTEQQAGSLLILGVVVPVCMLCALAGPPPK